MLQNILPTEIATAVSALPYEKIYELRFRVNSPITVCIAGRYFYLGTNGVTSKPENAISASAQIISNIVYKASNYSLYAVNGQICQGFLTIQGGIRIGVAGEVVCEDGKITTIKNISSLNIRIPHEIEDCSLQAFSFLENGGTVFNTLVIAPPGAGKTTFLRDLCCQVSGKKLVQNTLLLDERCELASFFNGEPQLDVGSFTDIYSTCTKKFGFENGIRSMRPDVIITDELGTEEDFEAVSSAIRCGVVVVASVHASSIVDLRTKPYFEKILANKLFDRFVVLSGKNGAGTLEGVFDASLKLIYV